MMTAADRLRIKWEYWRTLPVFWLVVVAVVCLIAFGFCRASPSPLPPKEAKTSDSLTATKPDYQARRDTLVMHETTYVRESLRDVARAATAEHAADSLRDVSQRWQAAAIAQGDTVTRWYDIAQTEQREADSLRSANADLHRAVVADSAAIQSANSRADEAERRLRATDDLNARLARDLARADPPCRIAWVLGCPSRTKVAIAAIAGRELVKIVVNVQAGKPAFQGVP